MEYKVEALDTNLLVYLVTGSRPELAQKLIALLKAGRTRFYVDDQAIIEMEHVLTTMKLRREQIAEAIEAVVYELMFITNKETFREVLPIYRNHAKLSLVDCYLAERARQADAMPLWTNDHKLAIQSPIAREFA